MTPFLRPQIGGSDLNALMTIAMTPSNILKCNCNPSGPKGKVTKID